MEAELACLLEVTARKPGNVHRFRDFDDAHFLDFLVSAAAVGRNLTADRIRGVGLGRAIRDTVAETTRLVGHNTNLGMVLLLAPLAAVSRDETPAGRGEPAATALRFGVAAVLARTTVDDARAVYEAIRLARPGGLGEAAEQDVSGEPTVTLVEAMRLAADRDAIARQYAAGYDDVFELGMPTLRGAVRAGRPLEVAIVLVHLTFMARRPDTLIARKCGVAVADESARRAAEVLDLGWPDRPVAIDAIRSLDAWLRADGHRRNPGASADLVCATIFGGLWERIIERPIRFRPRPQGDDPFP